MYFPYLRARQFELISLRELVNEDLLHNEVTPILEPVKENSFNNLNLAHRVFQEKQFNAYLIVNPFQGEASGDKDIFLQYLSELDNPHFLPAFHYSDNSNYIIQKLDEYDIKECMIICLDNFSDEESFKLLCENSAITHITLQDPNKYRAIDRHIKKLQKFYIRLDDVFEKQPRNSEFLNIPAHKFTEEHLYYREENYQGFSDFTVLPSEFIDGGSTPRAVVIHFTYLNQEEENQIWIRHFTSETNDSIANVQGKFYEAANKMVIYCDDNQITNSAIEELRGYLTFENENGSIGRYPGLGTVKKISLKNHLIVVSNFLNSL
ncbi:sce7725 family protein [Chryseobacterium sp. RU33C]|uniref:sce7725 family protein n=1 Tax=Chryseobacterium sp. RU33C TaxID=1907398 RepID=UPI000955B620|nr:sce7725 family protein [Chryseobacterium sp. RU33C]SIQ93193.1 hypothetical protein SAMN05880573_112136 [Chryseobacterium sp. RU33C]